MSTKTGYFKIARCGLDPAQAHMSWKMYFNLKECNNEDFCFLQELTFYKLTHPSDFIGNRHLFCLREISHEEKTT